MDVTALLESVQKGETTIEEATRQLRTLPYESLGFANLDHHRKLRTGCGEVIFCQGKTVEQVVTIFEHLAAREANVLATRANAQQAAAVQQRFPEVRYEQNGGLLLLEHRPLEKTGRVAVCTAGTADIPVAEEAAATAEFYGAKVCRFYDVGVAGIHRLFDKLPQIESANVIVAIAGMEGALAGVLAGLVEKPVIAVPTSVGYGASFHGLSALLTMLNSCAEGISVVNIDNGYGAGYLAAQINRLIEGEHP